MREMPCAFARQTVGDLVRLLIMTVYRTTMRRQRNHARLKGPWCVPRSQSPTA